MPNAPTIAIVGGGALGAALFGALVERLTSKGAARAKPRIVLVEKSEVIGRGLAYAKDQAAYLLNQSAQTMSLVPGRRSHFFEWLVQRGLAPADRGEHFGARQVFGDYVEDCFAQTLEVARRSGIGVSIVRGEVTSLAPRASGGYRVVVSGHAAFEADVAVLTVGNVPSARFRALEGPGFVSSPYPSTAHIARVPARARVAILGSGLSAIDAALALFDAGHEAPVIMASRHGMLPAVRGALRPCELTYATRANIARATDHGRRPLRGERVLRWLALELEAHDLSVSWDRDFPASAAPLEHLSAQIVAAENDARMWQSIGEALNPMVELLWHHLADDDKRLFLDHHRSRFMSHWVPIPLVTARRVLTLLRDGKLTVERSLEGVALDSEAGRYSLRFADRTAGFDFVVDATGAPRHLSESESPLLDSLARQGTIDANDFGGVRVDFESLRVLDRDGRADPSLFALGNLTCGTHLFTSTLELNVEKADRVAAHVVDEIHRRLEKNTHVDATPHSS